MQNRMATRAASTVACGLNPENGTEVWPPSALACGNPKEAESDPAGADFVMRAKPREADSYPVGFYRVMRAKHNNPAVLRWRRHFHRRPIPT